MTVSNAERVALGHMIRGALMQSYHSVSWAAAELQIPRAKLHSACGGDLDKLQVGELKKIAPLLPEEWRDELRQYVLP